MTRDEAISIMNVIVHMLEPQYDTDRIKDAVEMAIKALKQKPCDDAISRQAAINAAIEAADEWDGGGNRNREKVIAKALEQLPSVTPQPKEMT